MLVLTNYRYSIYMYILLTDATTCLLSIYIYIYIVNHKSAIVSCTVVSDI